MISKVIVTEDICEEERGTAQYIFRWIAKGKGTGIYLGEGRVIHLTRGQIRNGLIISSAPSHAAEGPVEACSLEEFLSRGGLYCFEYGVTALFFLLKQQGTCTRASCEPPQDVLFRASFLLQNEFGDYDLTNNNCEDFAFYCKIGLLDVKGPRKTGTSGQIASFVAIITTLFAYVIMPYGFLPTSFIGLALMFCFFYYNSRLHFDAGSRITFLLQKVSVEEFKQLSCSDTTEWIEHVADQRNHRLPPLSLQSPEIHRLEQSVQFFGLSWSPESTPEHHWLKIDMLFFACFVIQSVLLALGLDYRDHLSWTPKRILM
ncbi:hypothetical protein FNV43_RR25074 [Rhamnella rubrinervis]|uniref:LRAT domain-containing protein n=1 Tax=Rhamnella rubrinervis TaxID=2594499 RepID=A0A8K0DP09_9ROSA|nr:hypothetical protein FNV43_RR25074 [Rhamnella rubrinervis]